MEEEVQRRRNGKTRACLRKSVGTEVLWVRGGMEAVRGGLAGVIY